MVVLLGGVTDVDAVFAASVLSAVATACRDESTLDRCRSIAAGLRDSAYNDQRFCAELVFVRDAVERGSHAEALRFIQDALDQTGLAAETVEEAHALSVEAAVPLGDDAALEALVEAASHRPPASSTPILRAGQARLRAELAHRRGDTEAARCHGTKPSGFCDRSGPARSWPERWWSVPAGERNPRRWRRRERFAPNWERPGGWSGSPRPPEWRRERLPGLWDGGRAG